MAMVDAANRRRSTVPGHYIPMVVATTAHMDLCEPYLQTAIDTLSNPEVLMMYGFFSNHPPNGALAILEHYTGDRRVLAHLVRPAGLRALLHRSLAPQPERVAELVCDRSESLIDFGRALVPAGHRGDQ